MADENRREGKPPRDAIDQRLDNTEPFPDDPDEGHQRDDGDEAPAQERGQRALAAGAQHRRIGHRHPQAADGVSDGLRGQALGVVGDHRLPGGDHGPDRRHARKSTQRRLDLPRLIGAVEFRNGELQGLRHGRVRDRARRPCARPGWRYLGQAAISGPM